MVRHRGALLIAAALAVALGCTPDGQLIRPPGAMVQLPGTWTLEAVDPAGHDLAIVVSTGGCTSYVGSEVTEEEDTVTITATVKEPAPGADAVCPGDLRPISVRIGLAEPLGQRELRGCGTGACGEVRSDHGGAMFSHAMAVADEAAVLVAGDRMVALDPVDGSERWSRDLTDDKPVMGGGVVAAGDLVLRESNGRVLHAHEVSDGSVRWQSTSHGGPIQVDGDLVVLVRPDPELPPPDPNYRRRLAALDRRDGTPLWELPDVELGHVQLLDDLMLITSSDAPADLRPGEIWPAATWTVVAAHAPDDGTQRWSTRLAGSSEQTVVVGDVVVVKVWGGLFGLDRATGEVRWQRVPSELEGTLQQVGEEVVVASLQVDPATGELTPSDIDVPPGWPQQGAGLVIEPSTDGQLTVSGPHGRWTTDIRAIAQEIAVSEDLVVVRSAVGAVALDARDGALRWSWVAPDPDVVRPTAD